MPFDRRRGGSLMLMRSWLSINYLLRDEFLTDEAAPLSSPRTAEPGPGELVLGSNGTWLIDDGILETAESSSGSSNIMARGPAMTRAVGLALKHRTRQNPQGTGPNATVSPAAGWSTSPTSLDIGSLRGVYWWGPQFTPTDTASTSGQGIDDADSNTFYEFTHILRSAGSFTVIGDKLLFPSSLGNEATMYPSVGQVTSDRHTADVDYFRVAQLGGPWLDDYGIATQRLAGARSANDTFVHEANAQWVEFILTTLPSAGSITIDIRRQDANNKWQLEVTSAGAFNLNEVVAGTPTTRATIASNQAADRMMCVFDGARARIMRSRAGAISSSTMYTSVSTFTTETEGEVISLGTDGAISDLITWPRVLSGSALAWVQAL